MRYQRERAILCMVVILCDVLLGGWALRLAQEGRQDEYIFAGIGIFCLGCALRWVWGLWKVLHEKEADNDAARAGLD